MNTVIKWIKAARPHTMGLSFAVILAGSTQVGWDKLRWDILLLSLLAAGGFQLISNFANDYGDFVKGTDAHRPEGYRSLSAGLFTAKQVRQMIAWLSIISIICVVVLVWRAPVVLGGKWLMFALGVASVLAALAYTLGKRPYGYLALGDIMVFLFFGLVGVLGSYYLQGQAAIWRVLWLAIAYGALSTSVLNINNLRDIDKDRQHGKITIANRLGKQKALSYQQVLFGVALLAFLLYVVATRGLGLAVLLPAIICIRKINIALYGAKRHEDYNGCLAMTVKYTLLLSLPTAIVGLIGY